VVGAFAPRPLYSFCLLTGGVDLERPLFDQSFDVLQGFLDRLNAGMIGAEAAPLGVPDRILEELDLSVGTLADEIIKPAEEELEKSHAVF
jgi:hypothetical protein